MDLRKENNVYVAKIDIAVVLISVNLQKQEHIDQFLAIIWVMYDFTPSTFLKARC